MPAGPSIAHAAHPDAVADVGARLPGPLQQEVVEAAALGHQGDRGREALLARSLEAQPQQHPVNAVLDHRRDVEGQEADAAHGEPAAARLVAREALPVEHDHARARRREAVRGRGARGARPDDRDVDPLARYGDGRSRRTILVTSTSPLAGPGP